MTRTAFFILCLSLAAAPLPALSVVAAFAAKQEATIAERVAKEKYPLSRLHMEYLLRQDYSLRMEQQKEKLIRSGTLSTPEVETLKAERDALLKQLKALDGKILTASAQAPEIKELTTLVEANEKRIAALRELIAPGLNSKTDQSKVTE